MKIKICSIITAVALLLGVFPAVGAAESPVYTVDVPVSVDFGQASGINFTLQLNSLFVEAAEEIEGTRAPELDGKLFALFQKDDQINVGIASDTAFSCGGPLFSLRLTLRQPAGEEDELYKLVKLKVDEEPAWQTDTILLSGVREGGVYNRPVSIAFNEGTALLDGQPVRAANAYLFRYWLGGRFYFVSTNYTLDPVCILHLPGAAKDRQLAVLYRRYAKKGSFPPPEKVHRLCCLPAAHPPLLRTLWVRLLARL